MKKSLYLVLLISTSIYSSDNDYRSPKSGRPTISTAEQKRLQAIYCPDNSIKEDKVDSNGFTGLAITKVIDPFVALRQQEDNKQPSKKAQKRERKKAAAALALSKEGQPAALSQPKNGEGYGRGKGRGGRRHGKERKYNRQLTNVSMLAVATLPKKLQGSASSYEPEKKQEKNPVCLDRKEQGGHFGHQVTYDSGFNQDFPSIIPQQGPKKYAQEHRKTVENEKQARELQRIKELEDEERRELAEHEKVLRLRILMRNTSIFHVGNCHNVHFGYGGGD